MVTSFNHGNYIPIFFFRRSFLVIDIYVSCKIKVLQLCSNSHRTLRPIHLSGEHNSGDNGEIEKKDQFEENKRKTGKGTSNYDQFDLNIVSPDHIITNSNQESSEKFFIIMVHNFDISRRYKIEWLLVLKLIKPDVIMKEQYYTIVSARRIMKCLENDH